MNVGKQTVAESTDEPAAHDRGGRWHPTGRRKPLTRENLSGRCGTRIHHLSRVNPSWVLSRPDVRGLTSRGPVPDDRRALGDVAKSQSDPQLR
jgi:hypothetical protein